MRQWQAKKVTPETRLKREIRQALAYQGWISFPILQALGAYKGIVDIIALKKGKVLFIECKSERGKQSPDQKNFQQLIEDAGGNYILCRQWEDIEQAINPRLREEP